uniref:Uncharacterized protein n=1 Tax=Chromera velia CCMP2878 TaxID=1169474 RepID=A0A0G4GBK2_9ALVE|eukprot:Cvel_21035.t1-p1 / transcript=Cvel_21035.t1 / gene=Cvel_21035 / organism=Chromera_velia_CCMP2878 / gene_product=Acyl-CoA synthetase family member 2, mitochondrial, putative / transcript_product=Acyl-CoA synthetase family member 2, mitochondrial, putative / location=Cvel_scaffold1940:20506-28342(+) / protein_length=617 / sequence_SO=supercontig / SO=protein_coding / is_pseudo=false
MACRSGLRALVRGRLPSPLPSRFVFQGLRAFSSGFSYTHCASTVPLRMETVGGALEKTAEKFGDRLGLVVRHQGVRRTFEELNDRVDHLARGLISLGVQPGDRVGIWSPNCEEWVLSQYATAKVGAVLVNVNPAYRLEELEHALNLVKCRALILAKSFKKSNYLEALQTLCPEFESLPPGSVSPDEILPARVPSLRLVVHLSEDHLGGMVRFCDLMEMGGPREDEKLHERKNKVQADDPVNIQFTSGTTGRPKGATLSHHNIVNNGYFVGHRLGMSEQEKICIPVPLYHCFGMVMGSLAAVLHGATSLYPSAGFDPTETLLCAAEEGATALYGVPTMFIAMLSNPEMQRAAPSLLKTIRTGIMAGSPCPEELMGRVIREMGAKEMTVCYGMTETSPVSFQTLRSDPPAKRCRTAGSALDHVEGKIVCPQTEQVLPLGLPGELRTRGYLVMLGYWKGDGVDRETTSEVIDSARWMSTGDLAEMGEDGSIQIVGRLKDLIIRGGENIYPREIEETMMKHPAVEDAHAVGVSDERMGEDVALWVKLREGFVPAGASATASGEGLESPPERLSTRPGLPDMLNQVEGPVEGLHAPPSDDVHNKVECPVEGLHASPPDDVHN